MSNKTDVSDVSQQAGGNAKIKNINNYYYGIHPNETLPTPNNENPSYPSIASVALAQKDFMDFFIKKENKNLPIDRIKDVIKFLKSIPDQQSMLEEFIKFQITDQNVMEVWDVVEIHTSEFMYIPINYATNNFKNFIFDGQIMQISSDKLKKIVEEILTIPDNNLFESLRKWKNEDNDSRRQIFCYFLKEVVCTFSDQFKIYWSDIIQETDNCASCLKLMREICKKYEEEISHYKNSEQNSCKTCSEKKNTTFFLDNTKHKSCETCLIYERENIDLKEETQRVKEWLAECEEENSRLKDQIQLANERCDQYEKENSELKMYGYGSNSIYPEKINETNNQLNTTLLRITQFERYNAYGDIEIFDPKSNTYLTLKKNIAAAMFMTSITLLGNCLIMVGGAIFDGIYNAATNKTLRIDLSSKRAIKMADMKQKRRDCACAVVDDNLYVVGGKDQNYKPLQTVEMWDSYENKWELKSEMKKKRHSHSAIAYARKIFVFGGYDEHGFYLKSFEIYDPFSDQWQIYSLHKDIDAYGLYNTLATVHRDCIYVYEPYKESKIDEFHVTCFNPSTRKWTILPDIPQNQRCRNLVSFEEKLIYFGDYDNYQFSFDVRRWKTFRNQESTYFNSVLCVPSIYLNQ